MRILLINQYSGNKGNGKAGQSRTDRNSERGERQVWIAGGFPAGGIGR